jgi:hypothetical protein
MGNPQITLVTLVDVFIMVAWGISNHPDSFDIINDFREAQNVKF